MNIMTNYMNNAFNLYSLNLPDEINEEIIIKLKNQVKYESELKEYNKQLKELEKIIQINEERRIFAQIRVGLDPYNKEIPQMPYRHLREPIIPNKPTLNN